MNQPFNFFVRFLIVLLFVGMLGLNNSRSSEGASNPDSSSAAILDLTKRNKENIAEVIALKNSLDIFRIPYVVTEDPNKAAKHKVIYIAGSLFNTTLSSPEIHSLFSYVEKGGVVFSSIIAGNKYFSLFGIKNPIDSQKRYEVHFKDSSVNSALKYIDRAEEKNVYLGNKYIYTNILWTSSFSVGDAKVLATTEDNLAVLSVNEYGDGLAYAFGISLSAAISLSHLGGNYEAERGWANVFEPGADVYLLVLKAIYEENADPCVYISTIPYGRKTALLLSHDVDAQDSFKNSIDFAQLEKSFGVNSTFFIACKYFLDDQDIGYFEPVRISYIRKVKELGGDIGSHSVSHSKKFDKFPLGDPDVNYDNYRPLTHPSVFGEVKVSKELLDKNIPGQKTVAFRAGELRHPPDLVQALDRSGYLYDCSFSGTAIMANFAFRALKKFHVGAEESKIIEIPLIFDDSQEYLRADNVDEMVRKWLDIIWANADNEAISGLLIHPTIAGYKLKAEEKLLTALKGQDIWIGDYSSYGDFWERRSKLQFESYYENSQLIIRILNGIPQPDISFVVKAPADNNIRIINSRNETLKFTAVKRGDKLLLTRIQM